MIGQQHHHRQGEGGDGPVLPGAVDQGLGETPLLHHGLIGVGGAAGHIVNGGGIEGQADGKDHGAGDDRREKPADRLYEKAHQGGDDAAHQHGPAHRRHAAPPGGNGLHTGQVRKADTEYHRQARAEAAPNGEKLQQRCNGRQHQRRLDQQHLLPVGESGGVGDDNGRGDAAYDHGNQMLQGHGDGEAHRRQAPIPEQCLGIGGKLSHGVNSFAGFCRVVDSLYYKRSITHF